MRDLRYLSVLIKRFSNMKIIECPRDAIQGISTFISTEDKIRYINQLLRVGFDTIDFGSFVSHKSIPQLRDTHKVLEGLETESVSTKLLAIVANKRGAKEACSFEKINYLGLPLSVSEKFQNNNTNSSIQEFLHVVEETHNLARQHNKKMVVYLSMAFGNPYKEHYHPDIVCSMVEKLHNIDIDIIALADTIGVSNTQNISSLFSLLTPEFEDIEFGAHFHSLPEESIDKIESAYENGCRRFDGSIKGYGGCPMAQNEMVGNISTNELISFFPQEKLTINISEFNIAVENFENILTKIDL